MPRFITRTPATISASAPDTNAFLDMRGWMMALLIAVAIPTASVHPAAADIEVVTVSHIAASAPVETGIVAATAGRLRDAITILTPHADQGNATANYVLGLIYLHDRGALQSRPALSHRHFARAATSGHVASIFEAAFQFERGIGTARDMNRAIRLYQLAARANHLNAQFNLAILLSHQKANPADLRQAYFWAIAARNNAVKTGDEALTAARITQLARSIRSRIPHQLAAQALSTAARLTGQPV